MQPGPSRKPSDHCQSWPPLATPSPLLESRPSVASTASGNGSLYPPFSVKKENGGYVVERKWKHNHRSNPRIKPGLALSGQFLAVNQKIPRVESGPCSGSPNLAGALLFRMHKARPNPLAYVDRFRSWKSNMYTHDDAHGAFMTLPPYSKSRTSKEML